MDKQDQQQKLESYIYRLMKLKEEQASAFTARTMEQVAHELGLPPEDIAFIERTGADHQERAKTYEKAQRWTEAQKEWKAAIELLPLSTEPLAGMANSYFQQWQSSTERQHLTTCEQYIAQALEISPQHAPTLSLLQEINKGKKKARRRRRLKRVGYGFLGIIGIGAAVIIAGLLGVFRPGPTGFEGMEYEVPVTVANSPELEDIKMETARLRIVHSDYIGSKLFDFYYTGRVRFPQHDLRALRLGVDFFDEEGQHVADYYMWVTGSIYSQQEDYGSHRVPAGSWIYMNDDESWMPTFKGEVVKIAQAQFKHDITDRISPLPNDAQQALEIIWPSQKADAIDLVGHITYWAATPKEGVAEHYLSFEITNTGKRPCHELIAEVQYLDQEGNVADRHEAKLITVHNKPLQTQEHLFHSHSNYLHVKGNEVPIPYQRVRLKVKLVN